MATAYWEGPGAAKDFTHPVPTELVAERLDPRARILDFGCGYGRAMRELARAGYRNCVGVDPSAALIARGRREAPGLRLEHTPHLPLDYPAGAFAAVLLISVLAVIPENDAQRRVAAEVERVCAPGGLVFLCDYPCRRESGTARPTPPRPIRSTVSSRPPTAACSATTTPTTWHPSSRAWTLSRRGRPSRRA